jgi:hypothetical protein
MAKNQRAALVFLLCFVSGAIISAFFVGTNSITQPNTKSTESPEEPASEAVADWTFMVYLDGDNNLEAAGIKDLNEMEMIGSTSAVNIVVQLDRIPGYDTSNGDWTNTRRYFVQKDTSQTTIGTSLQSVGETNMGDPASLSAFVTWAQTNYPANKYALILWDHGSGPMWGPNPGGVCWDDTNNNDYLTLPEIETALTGKNIDLLGFDACLMGSAEIFYSMRNLCDVVVGSEKTEPGDGWPYNTILSWLVANPTTNASQLGSIIVDKYIESYSTLYKVTQSAATTADLEAIYNATNTLAASLTGNIGSYKSTLTSIRSAMYEYDDEPFVDLYDFAARVKANFVNTTIQAQAQNVIDAINIAIINSRYQGSILANSHGMTIYFPSSVLQFSNVYRSGSWANGAWDEFLLAYFGASSDDDQFEDNDDFSSPAVISPGYYPGLIWSDADYYEIPLIDGQELTITMTYTHTLSADLDLYLNKTDGTGLDYSYLETGTEMVEWTVSGGNQSVILFVDNYKTGTQIAYTLSIYVPSDDDIFEENDDWENATAWDAFVDNKVESLVCLDLDFYYLDLEDTTTLVTVNLEFSASQGRLGLDILGAANNESEPYSLYSVASPDDNQFIQFSTDDWMEEYYWFEEPIAVYYFVVINSENNTNYNLTISIDNNADDIYEDDSDYYNICPELTEGVYTDLVAIDIDFYSVNMTAGDWLEVNLLFSNAEGDLDLFIYDEEVENMYCYSGYWSDNERAVFKAPSSAIYLIVVLPYRMNLNYTLVINQSAVFVEDEYDGTNNFESQITTFPIITNGTNLTAMTAWQDDYFKITLEENQTIDVTLEYGGTEETLVLLITKSPKLGFSEALDYSYTSGTSEELSFRAPTTGTYIIQIMVLRPIESYNLTISVQNAPPPTSTTDTNGNGGLFAGIPGFPLGIFSVFVILGIALITRKQNR